MTILIFIVGFTACTAAGACVMRIYMRRTQCSNEHEDSRDAAIRDLRSKVNITRANAEQYRRSASAAEEHLKLAHQRIAELVERNTQANLQYRTCKRVLQEEIGRKNKLREQLLHAENGRATLAERVAELDLEPREPAESTDCQPEQQTVMTRGTNGQGEKLFAQPGQLATVPDNSSLIQSLTADMERWRRHCHVLGAELRQQREHLSSGSAYRDDTKSRPDTLTAIRGIGPILERKLHDLGIYRYCELADMNIKDLKKASRLIPDLKGRMKRDAWSEQARQLHRRKYQAAM